MTMMPDARYVCSVNCTWHGTIQQISTIPASGEAIKGGLPCCPYCRSPLLEYDHKSVWDDEVRKFAVNYNEPLYPAWVATLSGPCVPLKGWDWRKAFDDWKSINA